MKKFAYQKCGPGKRQKVAAWDVETEGLGGRILAASYMMEGDQEATFISGTGPEIIQELFYVMCENHTFVWYAHNAQYDLRYIVENLMDRMDDLSIFLRTDSDIFMVTLDLPEYDEKARLVIKDSFALFPFKLSKFAESMCPEYPKLTLDFEKETFDPKNSDHVAYAKRDVEALLNSLIRFDLLIFETFDVHFKATTASTALAAWERSLAKGEFYRPPSGHDDFIRSAYYGGLVFLTDTNTEARAKTYDCNSSYPYQMMTHPLPIGNPISTGRYMAGYLGIYKVTMKSPDDLIVPCIPVRDSKGIVWPSGQFETTATSVDIDFALKHGYRLLAIHEGLFWEESAKPFESFISKCRDLRVKYKGQPLEIVAKLMQNSLYGKFGSKKTRRKIYAHLDDEESMGCEPWGEFLIRDEIDDEMLALPQWAAFVTSYARRHLLTLVYSIGPERVLYGDTDSVTVREGVSVDTGKDYGQWKLEKDWLSFKARGPKVYAGMKQSEQDANVVEIAGAIKGIPRGKWKVSGALEMVYKGETGTIHYKTLPSLMEVLKEPERKAAHDAKRSLSDINKSRTWKVQPDGTVRPRSFDEIQNAKPDRKRSAASAPFGFGLEETDLSFRKVV